MNKKYQVFVSSTYNDLIEERKEVTQGILEVDCIPIGMELFPASNKKQWDVIKGVIDDCDYYLLIIAGKYGTIGEDEEGNTVSYTEMEFDYALKTGKPIITLIHNNIESLPSSKTETGAKIKRLEWFSEKARNGRLIKYWSNKDNLKTATITSLESVKRNSPGVGWVRADKIVESIHDYIVFPNRGRHGINARIEELMKLNPNAFMRVICYGTNKYGRIIEDAITNFHNIKVEVIVCSPFVDMFGTNQDKDKMFENINDMLKASNVTVMVSDIPPTIRSVMMYDNNRSPIWCSMQPYFIFKNEQRMFRGEAYAPAIVSDVQNDFILSDMEHYFNLEFKRLRDKSNEVKTKTMEEYYKCVLRS